LRGRGMTKAIFWFYIAMIVAGLGLYIAIGVVGQ
jgi:hypothetical protein